MIEMPEGSVGAACESTGRDPRRLFEDPVVSTYVGPLNLVRNLGRFFEPISRHWSGSQRVVTPMGATKTPGFPGVLSQAGDLGFEARNRGFRSHWDRMAIALQPQISKTLSPRPGVVSIVPALGSCFRCCTQFAPKRLTASTRIPKRYHGRIAHRSFVKRSRNHSATPVSRAGSPCENRNCRHSWRQKR